VAGRRAVRGEVSGMLVRGETFTPALRVEVVSVAGERKQWLTQERECWLAPLDSE